MEKSDLGKKVDKDSITGLVVESDKKEMLYKGKKTIALKDYLDSDLTFHNWSRSCDVGH
ncbi:MAG: hypothetical protein KKB39_00170 [Nanoarchaeota archaeon]|nr:hypothetical protein [Nanoarchaeota archaeon]